MRFHCEPKPRLNFLLSAVTSSLPLVNVPAWWGKTCCLAGELGRVAAIPRRARDGWFIPGLNRTYGFLRVKLDLSAFDGFNKRLMLVAGAGVTMQVAVAPLAPAAQRQHTVPPCRELFCA